MNVYDPSLGYSSENFSSDKNKKESINFYFLTLPQLMDYYECQEKANYKRHIFVKLFSQVMKEKYKCDIYGSKLTEGQITRKRKYSKKED